MRGDLDPAQRWFAKREAEQPVSRLESRVLDRHREFMDLCIARAVAAAAGTRRGILAIDTTFWGAPGVEGGRIAAHATTPGEVSELRFSGKS
jgi:hypothetical protein